MPEPLWLPPAMSTNSARNAGSAAGARTCAHLEPSLAFRQDSMLPLSTSSARMPACGSTKFGRDHSYTADNEGGTCCLLLLLSFAVCASEPR
eukprot:2865873-Pleurochrysis_carterae.AAC.1